MSKSEGYILIAAITGCLLAVLIVQSWFDGTRGDDDDDSPRTEIETHFDATSDNRKGLNNLAEFEGKWKLSSNTLQMWDTIEFDAKGNFRTTNAFPSVLKHRQIEMDAVAHGVCDHNNGLWWMLMIRESPDDVASRQVTACARLSDDRSTMEIVLPKVRRVGHDLQGEMYVTFIQTAEYRRVEGGGDSG